MGTALAIRKGMHRSSNPGYGWAVPNWTYNASQYAPGPKPAAAWPRSSYSVFGRGADYGGVGDFLTESSDFRVPNWALLVGGAYVLHKMQDGKKVPVKENPYGVVLPALFGIPMLGGILGIGAVGLGAKSILNIGDIFAGPSGVGLGLGLALGGLYAMKKGDAVLGRAMAGAFLGWGAGFAYEASTEEHDEGLLTSGLNWLI